ncbi:MarR family transcriptional regulator [Ramlibacter sp.]|uniref:MarR family winged helix-turn-helix transcriptional regulator n=1 Tax=Ramlibacter sp. TaxID=1917967 RepID=UPI0018409C0C|nr:MarR family transcriptional regulator [Ramlibacter sp.]MBA2672305.1 MarR family transcriptional regulator [Ramlibacter sp.]
MSTVLSQSKRALAAEVWRRMFDYFMSTSGERLRILAELDLTPNDSRALHTLDGLAGRTMRSLAEEWSCDASNATWIVNRLETRGLVERRAKPGDGRVKLVVLTAFGEKTRDRLKDAMYFPPQDLLEMPTAALQALKAAMLKLPR